ncbi:MAG: universal stress protein [Planctomycetaceae bacterium]|nr:universal stress protein [Planctomycetaceae bacterium]
MSSFSRDRVVIPIDFSEESQNALRVGLEVSGDVEKLHLIHVLPPLEAISPAAVWGDLTDSQREQSVRKYAQDFLAKNGASDAELTVVVGDPGKEITRFAEKANADLIIISSHGYHGFKRMILGSVAEAVIRHADCAVLVLRRTDAE